MDRSKIISTLVLFSLILLSLNAVNAVSNNTSTQLSYNTYKSNGTFFSSEQICNAAANTKNFIDTNKRIPNSIRVGSYYINPSEFLYLATTNTIQIKNRNIKSIIYKKINNPYYSAEDIKEGYLTQKSYLDFANRLNLYIKENNQAPSYGYNELGKMGFKSIIYNYCQIQDYYNRNNILPASIKIKPWYSIINSLKISIIVRNTGGNVRNNYYMNKYLSTTYLSQKIIKAARLGTPMVTLGNGNGPRVMVLAGIHGNELSSQIAAIKLINNLANTSFKGTIYIIPFAIPYDTAITSRYWNGKDPNKIANIIGTPSYQIVELAKKLKISVLVDFHSTQPGGYPGQDSVLCTLSPRYESYTLASYIHKATSSKLISYNQAGVDSPGAVEDECNAQGITSITSEVVIYHGTASNQKITKSYSQMIALLRYKKVI